MVIRQQNILTLYPFVSEENKELASHHCSTSERRKMELRVHIEKIFFNKPLTVTDLSEFSSSGTDELHPSLLKE